MAAPLAPPTIAPVVTPAPVVWPPMRTGLKLTTVAGSRGWGTPAS